MTVMNRGLEGKMFSNWKFFGICILCLMPDVMALEGKKVYGVDGQSFEFKSECCNAINITSVIWEYNQDKAAEWFKGDKEPSYYAIFKSVTKLDIETGTLTISNLQPHFSGMYSAQVNNKDSTQTLNLLVVDAVHVYGVKGQSIILQPEVPNVHVVSAQWILNDVVIAHLDEEVSESSHPSLLLDRDTYALNISYLQRNYTGLYIFTVNNQETKVSYQLLIKDKVLKLVIKKQCNSTTCNLRCTGEDNETPLVSWADNKGRKMDGPVCVIEKSGLLDVIYTCFSNSGSWENETMSEKELFSDHLILENADTDAPHIGLGIVGVFGVVFAVGVGVVLWKKRRRNFMLDGRWWHSG